MPEHLPKDDLEAAQAAIDHAQSVRRFHRRRTERGTIQREEDLRVALEKLREVMRPLRSAIGRFPYGPQSDAAERNRDEIRRMSDAVQRERRKLWKMQKR